VRHSTASERKTCGNDPVDGGGVVEYRDGNLLTATSASRRALLRPAAAQRDVP
jgi:hypothetical protein